MQPLKSDLGNRCTWRFVLNLAPGVLVVTAAFALAQEPGSPDLRQRGEEILRRFAEVNRHWLVQPPAAVRNFSYVLHRVGGTQSFEVTSPDKSPRAKLQGVTYSAMLQQIARAPQNATVREINEEPGRLRLVLGFKKAIRGAVGNGVEGSWNGYHTLGG